MIYYLYLFIKYILLEKHLNFKGECVIMSQWEKHKKAKRILIDIFNKIDLHRIIHYSCQSFKREENGQSASITSISIYSCANNTTKSFDIQSTAEKLRISHDDIIIKMDVIEKTILEDFFEYIKNDCNAIYINWNMRDAQYGFEALVNRYHYFMNEYPKYKVPPNQQINLAKLLEEYYGMNYVDDPKLKNIIKLNPILESPDFLEGEKEAKAFKDGNYNDILKSNLSKVRLINNILNMLYDRKLKVSISMFESFGFEPQVIFEQIKDSWWWWIFTFLMGVFLGKII